VTRRATRRASKEWLSGARQTSSQKGSEATDGKTRLLGFDVARSRRPPRTGAIRVASTTRDGWLRRCSVHRLAAGNVVMVTDDDTE
jgi:hypothetical protein